MINDPTRPLLKFNICYVYHIFRIIKLSKTFNFPLEVSIINIFLTKKQTILTIYNEIINNYYFFVI